jgi:peptide-methionine (S)-S-oxide reductase
MVLRISLPPSGRLPGPAAEAHKPVCGIGAAEQSLTRMTRTRFLPFLLLLMTPLAAKTESLVLGGGCFWCTEAAYELVPGVKDVVSGYAGGHVDNPTYEQIGTKKTGHAEVIKIDYDPAVVSLEKLLEFFWQVHNPTQVGGQGNDIGPQYRSIILYASPEQKAAAEKSRAEAAQTFRDPITTEIAPLKKFWVAEDYHQDYFRRNPNQGYCTYVIAPKVKKLKTQLAEEKAAKPAAAK